MTEPNQTMKSEKFAYGLPDITHIGFIKIRETRILIFD